MYSEIFTDAYLLWFFQVIALGLFLFMLGCTFMRFAEPVLDNSKIESAECEKGIPINYLLQSGQLGFCEDCKEKLKQLTPTINVCSNYDRCDPCKWVLLEQPDVFCSSCIKDILC